MSISMKKILYVHPYNNYTGSTKVIADILKVKYKNLSDVTIITETSQPGFLTGLGLNIINVPIIKHRDRAVPVISQIVWFIVGFFKVLFYCGRFDSVYINTILPGFAAVAARIRGKEVIYHIHEKWTKSNYKIKIEEFILNHTKAHHIFVSKYLQDQYPNIYSESDEILYNKLFPDYLSKVEIQPLEKHTRNRVIMLASLNKFKGVDMLLEVAKLLPDFHFTLIISSPQNVIDDYFMNRIPVNVEIYPRQSNIHTFLKDSDFIVNLSNPHFVVETFGLTIIEGMAYGLPAIVPNVGGPTEIVESGKNGYIVDVTNANEIAKKLKKCSAPDVYKSLYVNTLKIIDKFKYA